MGQLVYILGVIILFIAMFLRVGFTEQIFKCEGMDHFKFESECKEKQENNDVDRQRQILRMWGEPTVNEKGETVYKMPPQEVLDLLINPTRENAERYIRWNEKKLEAIQKAQKIVDEVTGSTSAVSIKDIKKVHFFFSPTCPYSVMQAPIIAQIAKHIGKDKVVGYPVSGDIAQIRDFMQKTGLNITLTSMDTAPEKNITAVPVTIVQHANGQIKRYDGFTQDFGIEGISVTPASQQKVEAAGGS